MKRSEFIKAIGAGTLSAFLSGAANAKPTAAMGRETDFSQLVVNCFGDSTTWGDNGIKSGGNGIAWPAKLQKILGFKEVRNFGKKGSRLAVTADRNDSFIERLGELPEAGDIILVLGGVNDFQHDVPLGNLGDADEHTFYGALDKLLVKLLAKYPQKKLIFMTPMKNRFQHPTKHYPDSFTANRQGLKQVDYVEAIRTACDYYSVPVFDLYRESGISPFHEVQAKLFMPDCLHYNEAGYERLAQRIAEYLKNSEL